MIENIVQKAIVYFNQLSEEQRTIPSGAIYLLTFHHLLREVYDEDVFVDWKETGESYSGEYQGSVRLLWVGPYGDNLVATDTSFYMLSKEEIQHDTSLIDIVEISPDHPNVDGLMLDSEWVDVALSNRTPSPDYENKFNVFTMAGDGAEHEMWVSNPTYLKPRNGDFQIGDAVMRLRPLYSFDQLVFKLPDVTEELKGDQSNNVILTQLTSMKPLCFDPDTQARISFNPAAAGTNIDFSAEDENILFHLRYTDLGYPPAREIEEGHAPILTLKWWPHDPWNSLTVVDSSESETSPGIQAMKHGLVGTFYWVWESSNFGALNATAVLKDVSITLYTKMRNQFTDKVTEVAN